MLAVVGRVSCSLAMSTKGAGARPKKKLIPRHGLYRALSNTGAAIELAQSPPRKRGRPRKPDQSAIAQPTPTTAATTSAPEADESDDGDPSWLNLQFLWKEAVLVMSALQQDGSADW